VLFLLIEVSDLSFEFDQLLLIRGEVVFDIIDEGQLGFEFVLYLRLERVAFRAVHFVVQLEPFFHFGR
jgi:hypothetical protein